MLSFGLLRALFTSVLGSSCSAVEGGFLAALGEIWPTLFLLSGASVLGIAAIIQEPKKWHFSKKNEGGLMGVGTDLLVGVWSNSNFMYSTN